MLFTIAMMLPLLKKRRKKNEDDTRDVVEKCHRFESRTAESILTSVV